MCYNKTVERETTRKEGIKMKYSVWHVTDKDFVEVARFADEEMANSFRALASLLGDRYEVTKVGETPIW